MYVEPNPDVFQLPETVHAPVVTVIVPDVPPVIVTPLTKTVDAFAVRMPPLPTTTSAASAAAPRARSVVASAVVETVSETVSVVSHLNPRVAIVNVCAVPAELVKVAELNSASTRFVPAKVIVPPVALSNKIEPVPDSQTVPSVLAFVHVPDTVHASEPKSMADVAAEMFTLPVTLVVPDVLVMSPPLIVRLPWMVRLAVPFAIVLPLSVRPSIVIEAAPDVVSDVETVAAPTSSEPVEIVIVPPECVNVPVFWNVNVAMANVPVKPALLYVPVVTFMLASRVPVPAPEAASMKTLLPAAGTVVGAAPPDVAAQQPASVPMSVTVQSTSPRTRYQLV